MSQPTDKELEIILKPFIGNVKARNEKVLKLLDLRLLYNVTKNQIEKHDELKTLDINVLVNNTLIFNLTNLIIRNPENINDDILLSIITHKSFIGEKKPKD